MKLTKKEWRDIWMKVATNPWWEPDQNKVKRNIEKLVNAALRRKGKKK